MVGAQGLRASPASWVALRDRLMALLKVSYTMRQSMAAVVIVAVALALLRGNAGLVAVVGCLAGAALLRMAQIVRSRRSAGTAGSAGLWLVAGLDSLVASTILIGSADVTVLVAYFVFHSWLAPRYSDGPEPYPDWGAVFLAIPSGATVGFFVRCLIWDRPILPGVATILATRSARAERTAELSSGAIEGEPIAHRAPIPRRPIRAAAMVAGVVTLVGSWVAFAPDIRGAPPIVLAFALGYGVFLGGYVVGLLLARDFPATRWWCFSAALPMASMGMIGYLIASRRERLLGWYPIIGRVSLSIVATWLLAGLLLAILGWWSYACQRWTVSESERGDPSDPADGGAPGLVVGPTGTPDA